MFYSSSAIASQRDWKNDVFVSFRGEDTRRGFVSHLYHELERNQIKTFVDSEVIGGEAIVPALLEKIDESHISVVVLSENYAFSRWCLQELALILECMVTKGQIVFPIYYQVDPRDIRNQTGPFSKAFDKHESRYDPEEVRRWRRALREITDLAGFPSDLAQSEAELIQEIVAAAKNQLHHMLSSNSKGFFGIDSQIEKVLFLLHKATSSVCTVLGIWGLPGIGKTTIAEVVFDRISNRFEGRYFLPNAREELEKCTLVDLRNRILSKVLGRENLDVGTPKITPTYIGRMLESRKILIVLDGVNSSQLLEALVGEEGLFGKGSVIIVTSRDKQVLKNLHATIYEVKELDYGDARELFNFHAFRQNHPTKEYMQLSNRAVKYAKGIPLVLKVLGSKLYGKSIEAWKSELAKLEETLDGDVQNILRTSFDLLDWTEKSIFLDIACFFRACNKDLVQQALDLCGFYASIGITRLIDSCLIYILDKEIRMLTLLQQLGQDIVRQEHLHDPGKRSRLWIPKEIYHVLTLDKGTEMVEAISLNLSNIGKMDLSPMAFKGMCNLRLLKFYNPKLLCAKDALYNPIVLGEIKIRLPQGLDFLSNELRILRWDHYPLKSLPSNFWPEKLVELRMPNSCLERLWDEFPPLVNLTIIDLCHSMNLSRLPNLYEVPNLQVLDLSCCGSLVAVPSSIKNCRKLTNIDLSNCKNLCSFPSCPELTSLEVLCLKDCPKITDFPMVPPNLKYLYLGGTAIEQVPSSMGHHSQLVLMDLSFCTRLERLPSNIGQLKCLVELNLSCCPKLSNLPNAIYDLESLQTLNLSSCRGLNGFPENSGNLESSISYLGCLQYLDLEASYLSEIPSSFGSFVSLRKLNLIGNYFTSIPASIKELFELRDLNLSGCARLQALPELPSGIQRLIVQCCVSLESVQSIFSQVEEEYEAAFEIFNFAYCIRLNQDACIKIMADAQLRIQLMATSLFDQETKESGNPIGARFCVPGSDVPEWFSNQNKAGSSLKIAKLPHSCSSRFSGCVFCAVIAFRYQSEDEDDDSYDEEYSNAPIRAYNITCEGNLITELGPRDLHSSFTVHKTDAVHMTGKSNHVFIWYDSSFKSSFNEATFNFYLDYESKGRKCPYEVIKCGIHLLYSQDDEQNMDI